MADRGLLTQGLAEGASDAAGKTLTAYEGPTTTISQKLLDVIPFGFLEPLPGATLLRNLARDWSVWSYPYQVVSVAQTPEQAEWMAWKWRETFRALDFVVDGFTIMAIDPDGGSDTPEPVGPDLWSVTERFNVHAAEE